jgi:GR25 family glycosyltransferase involved in LPS biosynthesis
MHLEEALKLRAVHLLSEPDSEREKRSRREVSQLARYQIQYIPIINEPFSGEVAPSREANDRGFNLTPRHYGCYKAHRDAIDKYLVGVDALLVFECDAAFTEGVRKFYRRIRRAYQACIDGNLLAFTFGPKHDGKTVDTVGKDVIVISQFIETHAYLVPFTSRGTFMDAFAKPWDALDYVYTVYLYDHAKQRIGTFRDRATAFQCYGFSLIDGVLKNTEIHHKYKLYD